VGTRTVNKALCARMITESKANTVTTEVWFIRKLTARLLNYVIGCIVG